MARTKFACEVLTPEGLAFSGDVEMVSTKTTTGMASSTVSARRSPRLRPSVRTVTASRAAMARPPVSFLLLDARAVNRELYVPGARVANRTPCRTAEGWDGRNSYLSRTTSYSNQVVRSAPICS